MSRFIVYTGGTFDILHKGHINLLKSCKKISGYDGKVVVGLNTDDFIERYKGNAPYRSYIDRKAVLEACKYVDEVIPFETEQDLVDMILTINPDIRIVGEEYKDKEHTGKGLCHIHYNKRRHSFSSSELRERVTNAK